MSTADPWGLFLSGGVSMTKVAILIDGGYLLKRLPTVCPKIRHGDARAVNSAMRQLVTSHLERENKIARAATANSLLYRVFYYDAVPYGGKEHKPISNQSIDYAQTIEAKFRHDLFNYLRHSPNTAVRLGEVRRVRGWVLKENPQKRLLKGELTVDDLKDDDFGLGLRQKAVDMRIGVDITSITLKRQANTIILVSGDADFVPAAKLARREGVRIILDPLWRSVAPELFEHIDGLSSGFPRPPQSRKT